MAENYLPQILSKGGYTALMRVVLDQDDLVLDDLQSEPLPSARPNDGPLYRIHLIGSGEAGRAELDVVLRVLPGPTWSEAFNLRLDAPAEIRALESDLLSVLPSSIIDPTIASARAREGRPAWIMTSPLAETLGPARLAAPLSDEEVRLMLYRLAEMHALHWNAAPVLDFVYPWLTRQAEWLRAATALYAGAMAGDLPEGLPSLVLQANAPDAGENLRALFDALPLADAEALYRVLQSPDALIERLAAAPPTVVHGAPTVANIGLTDDHLVVVDWAGIQVAPSTWDVWALWSSLREPPLSNAAAAASYLDALHVLLDEGVDREAWGRSYAATPVASFLLRDLADVAAAPPNGAPDPAAIERAKQAATAARAAGL